MELTYTKVGDYYIPDLALDDDAEYEIGIYGRMRQRFLKEHHSDTYTSLILAGKLWKLLAEFHGACREHMDYLITAMARQKAMAEALKAIGQMEWVGRINNIRSRAEEIIPHELIYA